MPLAVYDWVESPGTSLNERPRVAATRFGDGYEQRAPDGLNPITQTWQVVHRAIDIAVAEAIVAFLRARLSAPAGLEAFEWWPPRQAAALRFTCREWTMNIDDETDTATVTATFVQEHAA